MGTLRGLGVVGLAIVIFPTLGLCVGRASRRCSIRINRSSRRVRSASIRTCAVSRRPVDQSLRALSHVRPLSSGPGSARPREVPLSTPLAPPRPGGAFDGAGASDLQRPAAASHTREPRAEDGGDGSNGVSIGAVPGRPVLDLYRERADNGGPSMMPRI